jgi:transcription termination factor NusB
MTTHDDGKKCKARSTSQRERRAAERHQGRILALQVLYETDLTGHEPESTMQRALDEANPVNDRLVTQVQTLVRGVLAHQDEIDPMLAESRPCTFADRAGGN